MGVPPIHTPASFLLSLPSDVLERLYVVHVADKDVPEGLKKAKCGVENTIILNVEPPSIARILSLATLFGTGIFI